MNRHSIVFIFLILLVFGLKAQTSQIYGIVVDEYGNPLELINVTVKGLPLGTSTNTEGFFRLDLKPDKWHTLVFSSITHQIAEEQLILKEGERRKLNVTLTSKSEELEQVVVEDQQVRKSAITRLDPRLMSVLPSASGNFESILKTLPGVSSNNELSSQYSVRGGNYDENMIYVNDIMVYRPFLIRSGQQEGMSFINSDMVSSVLFSSGGFDAKYGDKMSSVLDIRYRKPTEFGGAISASLMGTSLMFEGRSKDKKFTHISGFRYQSTKYVLNSLETDADYDPRFLDFQTYMTYALNKKSEISLLGNIANNSYTFIPYDRTTKFGTVNQALELNMFYEGKEIDKFNTATGALAYNFKPNEQVELKFIGSAFVSNESETFDILTEYWINEVNNDLGSENLGDSIDNLGIGSYLEHARNYLYATIYSAEHKGRYYNGFQNWQWGINAQQEQIEDKLSEWTMTDSADYSLPYTDTAVGLTSSFKARNAIYSYRYGAFLQNTFTYDIHSNELNITAGVRAAYWDFNNEFIASPRLNVALKPDWEKDMVFRFSTGIYYQPPFYKEMRSREGVINDNIKSQKSVHFVLGSDYNFTAWNRPFKLVAEAYYKMLSDLVYYSIDNVRILYSGQNDEKGYAYGLDMKVNGEFVKGVDSWFSLSVMRTQEDIINDVVIEQDAEGNNLTVYPGYMPRPSDQRVNVGVFFQDYLPRNPDYKMHMQLNYGTGLPFNAPNNIYRRDEDRYKSYQRVDLGFSKVLKRANKEYPKGHFLHHVNDAWISLEVFNLLNRDNTISYEWVADYQGHQYAVENSLTGRRVNLKLMVQF